MLVETVRSVFAHFVDAVEIVMLDRARKRAKAMAVRHIEDLPAYLRRDIGIRDDADIVEVVEHGLARRPAGKEIRHGDPILPHAI
ncbi:MAG: hypothetical protein M9939_04820 [Mesorhizobium sp.]|nr:hypothetical protein [Mesorhizobium sp.]MCO5160434.1 hypothetical protein [Mesorhizobium sp.]